MKSGLYIVTLNNEEPISVNANDPRIANKAIKVTKAHCKFGKAKVLEGRRKNYYKTFGEENVNYFPIVRMLDIESAEKAILAKLNDHRMRGRTGRRNEWLEGIEPKKVLEIALSTLDELDIEYELLLEGTLC
jgi:hypothetical protein